MFIIVVTIILLAVVALLALVLWSET